KRAGDAGNASEQAKSRPSKSRTRIANCYTLRPRFGGDIFHVELLTGPRRSAYRGKHLGCVRENRVAISRQRSSGGAASRGEADVFRAGCGSRGGGAWAG